MTEARWTVSLLASAALSLVPFDAAAAESLRLTFGAAVEMSLARAPDVASARAGVSAAESRATGTASQRLPKLRAEANAFRWDKALLIAFGTTNGMPSSAFVAREQVTTLASVSLSQPISGLFVLHHLIAIDRSAAEAARADFSRARLDAAARTADAYLRLLQAKAVEQVAGKTLTQIEAQLAQAVTMEKGGVLSKVDVLRLTSA